MKQKASKPVYAKRQRAWLVYGRFGKARDGQVIQEWRGHATSLVVAARKAVLDIMRRPDIKRLRHTVATFTIEDLSAQERKEG